jgi:hypothetical protein
MRIFLLGLVAVAACGTDVEPLSPAAKVTFYKDVAPILSEHCTSCHQAGGIAPFALTDYDSAHDNATRMVAQVDGGTMPPFYAREEPSCTPRFGWKDDPRLSAAEKQTLHDWIDGGLVEGDVAPIAAPASTDLQDVSQTLTPATGYAAKGDRDLFMCTVLDPQSAGAFVTGLQVRPGIPEVVHHVVVTELEAGSAQDTVVAAHGIGQPWDCSGETVPGTFVVNIWTPGNQPMQTPSELAVPLVAKAMFVMQIHYHPAGNEYMTDTTSLDLHFSAVWPKKLYFVDAFGNATVAPQLLHDPDDRTSSPEFRIPANKADHEEHMRFTVGNLAPLTNVQLYSANPHMHLVGTHISGSIERPAARGNDPQTECLANGTWNFDWQRTYVYDAPLENLPSVQPGDIIDVQCHWNNTLDNPFVQRALADEGLNKPVDISLGEGGSTDEMCLEIFGIAVDAPPPTSAARSAPIAPMIPPNLLRAI